ncbi:hypothetical protein C0991_002222, partial [Blastosporella zonata]
GTPPFMAIEILMRGARHRVHHDLESLFYVLLYLCTNWEGPEQLRLTKGIFRPVDPERKNHYLGDKSRADIATWFLDHDNFRKLAYVKLGILNHGFSTILEDMDGFHALHPYLERMYRLLFTTSKNPLNAPKPICIMKIMLDALQDPLVQAVHFSGAPYPSNAKSYSMLNPKFSSIPYYKAPVGPAKNHSGISGPSRQPQQEEAQRQPPSNKQKTGMDPPPIPRRSQRLLPKKRKLSHDKDLPDSSYPTTSIGSFSPSSSLSSVRFHEMDVEIVEEVHDLSHGSSSKHRKGKKAKRS